MSRPSSSINETILESPEPRPTEDSRPSLPKKPERVEKSPAGNNNMLIIGAVAVLVIGALVLGFTLPSFFAQPSATVTSAPTDAPLATNEATLAPSEEVVATEAVETTLQAGDTIRLEDDVITYARVNDTTVAAFVAAPNSPYLIDEIFTDSEGTLWYRLSDANSAQSGWVSENNLPAYRIQRD